ncbi:acyl-homoserine-lactone synthase [Mesobacterium sp. TK19101]|uniref:Acyl-homoserine-lactone synthase n=1 Tax=Mesobacterium hydrothermale TaxID=3111907 RepID=A0ABU6HFM2_9RHOB|nr:acyl-homoserine-lactone synthase [Mesobacterium sp. TK19101]MEC3860273.1 acyl-homoserine-lactone synthase [Mesobacterium sp. TK19101]
MIIVIDALNASAFGEVLSEMYRLRARVFKDRLDWEVDVVDSMERDVYDDLDPAHVVCLDDDTGRVVGCMRLLQTTGPHMLSDVFASILDGEPPLRSPQVWEATRFCVDVDRLDRGRGKNSISYVTSEVMIGAFEYGRQAGITDAVAVIDPVMNRVMKRSNNAPYDYLGSPKPMGKVTAMAALMDCSEERIAGIRAFSGIAHDVFGSEDAALALFERSKRTDPMQSLRKLAAEPGGLPQARSAASAALRLYCLEQLSDAQDDDERNKALALMQALARRLG